MSTPAFRRLLGPLVALVFLAAAAPRAAAELVWTPGAGWKVDGGVFAGLVGQEAGKAKTLMDKAREAEEKGNLRVAAKTYEKAGERYGNSVFGPEAYFRAAKMRLARREYYKAFENFQHVIGRFPNDPRFGEIIVQQYRIAATLMDGGRNRTWGWLPGFRNRERAIEMFELLLVNAPHHEYAPLAMMAIARAHERLGNEEEAIDALDRMINAYGQSLLAPDAYLRLAQTHASLVDGPSYDQASTKDAITFYEDFLILFPSDGGIVKAESGLEQMKTTLAQSKITMGDFYFYKRSNFKAARVFYNEAITAFPDSAIAAKARERLTEVDAREAQAKGETGAAPRKKFLGLF